MALLFMDGFDHYGFVTITSIGKWETTGALSSGGISSTARTGTYAGSFANYTEGQVTKQLSASGGFIVGFALRLNLASTEPSVDFVEIREDTTKHLQINMTAARKLAVKCGSTVLGTGATTIALSTWYYIELKGTIHDTTGSYELRIDGVTELSATNVDTRNGGTTGQWNRVHTVGIGYNTVYIDDFYVCDTSGSAPQNTFLGLVKVETLMPQTDAVAVGSNTGLTPSTSTDHGALVDEIPPNTSDYNSGATVGLKDTYNYPSMSLTGTVYGVQTNLYCAKSDAGVRQVCAVVRSNSVDYDGANISPLTTFNTFSEMRQVNPNTSAAWTTTEIASIQAGMKITV